MYVCNIFTHADLDAYIFLYTYKLCMYILCIMYKYNMYIE